MCCLQIVIPESGSEAGVAELTVERGVASVGEVTVYWEVDSTGRQDLEPVRGNLTFSEVHSYTLCSG